MLGNFKTPLCQNVQFGADTDLRESRLTRNKIQTRCLPSLADAELIDELTPEEPLCRTIIHRAKYALLSGSEQMASELPVPNASKLYRK